MYDRTDRSQPPLSQTLAAVLGAAVGRPEDRALLLTASTTGRLAPVVPLRRPGTGTPGGPDRPRAA